ncbi:hypothetical protein WN943_024952 [Citrus x changshan-huyou]
MSFQFPRAKKNAWLSKVEMAEKPARTGSGPDPAHAVRFPGTGRVTAPNTRNPDPQVSEIRIGTSSLRLSTITSSHHLSFTDGDAVLTVTAPLPPRTAKHSRHSSVRQRALHCLVSFSAAATVRRRSPP